MVGELYKFGGASEMMEILANRLKVRGHNVILLFGYNPGNQKSTEKKHYILFRNDFLRKINNKLRFLMEKYNVSNIYAYAYILLTLYFSIKNLNLLLIFRRKSFRKRI